MFENNQNSASLPSVAFPASRIAAVRCRVYRAPISQGVAMSFAPLSHRVMFLVELSFADGSTGLAESWVNFPVWGWRERVATVLEGVAPLLVGRTFSDTAEVRELLLSALTPVGRQAGAIGPVFQTISAIDQILWLRAAEARGVPLAALIADSPRGRIPAYGSSLGPDDVAESAERCLALGLRAAKVKLGFGEERDRENLRTARRVLGDDYTLLADANQGWDLEEAVRMAKRLEEFDLGWMEEPIRGDAPRDLEEFAARTGIPVATGENLYGADSFLPYLSAEGVTVLQPDVGKVGGVSDYLGVVAAARGSSALVAPHQYNGAYSTAVSLQLAAANPTTPWLEWDIRQNPVREPVDHLLGPDGFVTVPDGPGIGLHIDLEPLAPHLVDIKETA
ncbi:mandelate racemase/muconate lactonizing enzyme family protein [Leucobacter sp. CSA1]|uniref:Mandelate racemase/muconate lactonizing enzyme family protein n=1 Tax=Leucobacter chromiisoli TaxID=2796471 RepID=A0A934UV14_9MICO|nr:mandelate racemase/muconate lactonizing enzyme family protein [Leucobacter chromiisoli]MBK0419405.1 mandelate racemase/muconate lactonizing enzyme family protein [Leucobacter chromiisoli]